ncbi:hypothetical protein PMAYCL1PPCAC_11863, partial [Pristionchus mayeri]
VKMQRDDYADPDSGHPTPRDEFNPEEATTSTPISFRRRPSGIRPNSSMSDLFSTRESPRPSNSHSSDYIIVNSVIELTRKNQRMEEELDQIRNQSMMSEQELETSKARIAELEEQARYFTWAGPTFDLRSDGIKEEATSSIFNGDEKWREQEEKWMEGREEMKKKEEMEEKLKEELDNERRRVDEMKEWQLKCERMEAEKEENEIKMRSDVESIEELLKEKEEEIEMLKEKLREWDRDSFSDSASIRAAEREVKERRRTIHDETMNEEEVEEANRRMMIDNMRRRNKELEEEVKKREKEMEELRVSTEEEKKKIRERMEEGKEDVMKRANSFVERNKAIVKEKEEEMNEEMRRMEKEMEDVKEELKR